MVLGCGARAAPSATPDERVAAIATTSAGATPATPRTDAGYTGLGADNVPAELIARHAPPALTVAVARRIQAMLDIRGASAGILTREADRMVFAWRVTGSTQVWRQDGPMAFPIQLTGGEDPTTPPAITHDQRWVIVGRDQGGLENPGLYLLPIEGGPMVTIHDRVGVQTLSQLETDDGRTIYYTANDRDPSSRVPLRPTANRDQARGRGHSRSAAARSAGRGASRPTWDRARSTASRATAAEKPRPTSARRASP